MSPEAAERNVALRGGAPGLKDAMERASVLARGTVCLTLLAGSGSRWVRSLREAAERGDRAAADFPDDAPRGLFPVANFLGDARKSVPVASYSVDALRGLGRHLLVVRGWESEIRDLILGPLGLGVADFFTQADGPLGKPAGHGDATRQCAALWKDARFLITNFGGDANSPLTALQSLLAMDELARTGTDVGLLLPVALADSPAYPVILDEAGLPMGFGHDKLSGAGAVGGAGTGPASGGQAYTNVGIRVYRVDALLEAIDEIAELHGDPSLGYSIPGNAPGSGEFALDNIDALLASRGRARILPVAHPRELTPAKSYGMIPAFERAIRDVRSEWDAWRAAGGG